jgi:uncharacterized membrane protein
VTTPDEPIEIDLSKREQPRASAADLVRVSDAAEAFERAIRGRQEWVRTALAVGAFLSLVVILLVILFSILPKMKVDDIEKVSAVLVTPLTGIVGTIIGFYFAEKRGAKD